MYCITVDNIEDVCTEPWFYNSFWENIYAGNVDMDQDDFDMIVFDISMLSNNEKPTYKFKLLQLAVYLCLDISTQAALILTEREFCSTDERCKYIASLFDCGVITVSMESVVRLKGIMYYRSGYVENILRRNIDKFSTKDVLALGTLFNMFPEIYEHILSKKKVSMSAKILAKLLCMENVTAKYVYPLVCAMTKKQKQIFHKYVQRSTAFTTTKTITSLMCLKSVDQKNILYATYEYPDIVWLLACNFFKKYNVYFGNTLCCPKRYASQVRSRR
jgi:hypothetical protein